MENRPMKRSIAPPDGLRDADSVTSHIISPKRRRLSGEQAASAEQMDVDQVPNESQSDNSNQNVAQKPKMYFDLITEKKVLEKIFDRLQLYDLLQVCEADPRYVQIIGEVVMMKRGILNITEISQHYSVRHALKKFGRFVREVSFKQSDIQWKNEKLSHIEEIVRLIGKRCSSQELKQLTITFDLKEEKAHKFRKEIPDCLKTLESLTIIQDCQYSDKLDTCLKKILSGCPQLKVLKCKNLKSSGSFLAALNSMQLVELHLKSCYFNTISFYKEFLELGMPSLKTFSKSSCYYPAPCIAFGEMKQIVRSFPALESLEFNYRFDDPQILSRMANLRSLRLIVGFGYNMLEVALGCKMLLAALKTMNFLEELSIHSERSDIFRSTELWKEAMQGLTSLRSISFYVGYEPKWPDIINVIKELPSVASVSLTGRSTFYHIEQLIAVCPNVSVIKIDMPINGFTLGFYEKLVQTRQLWHSKSPQLNLYIDFRKVSIVKRSPLYAMNSRCIALHPIEK